MFLTRQWLNVALCGASIGIFGLAGCADRPKDVPATATLTTQGRDKIVYTAEQSGTVWVADKDSHKIVYSTHVNPGDRVMVDSSRDEIRFNDRVVTTTQLTNNPHNIYFLPGRYDTAVGGTLPSDATAPRPSNVGGSAMLVGQGKNRITYTADRDGTVWIANRDRDRVVYSGRLMRGDTVTVDAAKDLIAINGNRVAPGIAVDNVEHRVYFQPMDSAALPAGASVSVAPGADRTARGIDRPSDVPLAATLRATSDQPIEFTPDVDGTVWVVTSADNRVIYTGRVIHGDHVIINPLASALTVNGHAVYDRQLPRDNYRVYFLASAR